MNKFWMMCGVLVLLGCQKEDTPPAATQAAGAVVAPVAPPSVAQEVSKAETAPAKPVAKAAPVVKAAPAEQASARQAPQMAAPVAVPPASDPLPPPTVAPAPAQLDTAPGPAVMEAAVLELARKSNCFACHALDKKVVGPAWKAVAAKYRGDANAQRYLENKIAKGGGGVWGGTPMPAQPKLDPEQRAQLARFILNLQ
ncbi:c-type cytochrome [Ferrigenium sp. UT5]|uniref:c-type cytochrome n=1 Tax=Ferrigenium sp. UT5 TaxID=3242105 RepID=UPI0035533EBD